MARHIQMTVGDIFGRWVIIGEEPLLDGRNPARWLARCECGTEAFVFGFTMRSGASKGCAKCSTRNKRHGLADTKVHRAWSNMLHRCRTASSQNYENYGGRGITVCERWNTFENFLEDMGEPTPGMSLDRIDVNGNYEPSNCRWATAREQGRNRRNTIMNEDLATEILGRFEHGECGRALSKRFDLQRSTIVNLIMGSTWTELHRPWVGPLPAAL